VLSDDGRAALELLRVGLSDEPAMAAVVEDTDDLGLWVRIRRHDGDHLVLIRWEYALTMDFSAGGPKSVGVTT
jgi:hypothetical protein